MNVGCGYVRVQEPRVSTRRFPVETVSSTMSAARTPSAQTPRSRVYATTLPSLRSAGNRER